MCQRCDGGSKPLVKIVCQCGFVYYHVDDPNLDEEFICIKCGNKGVPENDVE